MDKNIAAKFKELSQLIGNTPLIELHYSYKNIPGKVYIKAEYYNLTGSIKDRPALYIMKKAYEQGIISATDIVTEATSGNAGISFCAIGSHLGHKCVIYMPDWMSVERISLMESFGADVKLVSKAEGGFLGSIEKTKQLFAQGGVFLPNQFANPHNPDAHYFGTGSEIVAQLAKIGLVADGFVGGVGTGGTTAGTGRRIKEVNSKALIMPLEPESSPTLTTGYKVGSHRIAGISDEFIPQIVHDNPMDNIIQADDGDSINLARQLSRVLGLGVGISSGANLIGAIKAKEILGKDAVITTVFPDDNKKYLSTDYCKPQPEKDEHITPHLKLIGFNVIK